ncbi:unnamed protein product [Taenia asiatica]|uniref:Uncharacterized protein n=1 Tax=Taenia asiatica TaxID=60517 RepID=A0A158R6R8_TAEAS|nr:unnamed protein product [Taenia asiatica]
MAAYGNRAFSASDYACVSNRLHRVVSNWSLPDLDKIIWALERDNMLSAEELSTTVPSKKTEDIEQLIALCLSSEGADFGENFEPDQISTEESTLEVVRNSLKSVVPAQFSPGPGISSVLRDIAKKECPDDTENTCTAGCLGGPKGFISPDYGRIYEHIADLLTLVRTRPRVEDGDVVALLDMLFCLLQATDYLVTKGLFEDIERTFSDVSDKIGVLISSISASYHHRCAFLSKISVSPAYEIESLTSSFPQDAFTFTSCRPNVLPCMAPILVLKEAWLSSNLSQCILLKKAMKDIFREYWQLPVVDEDENLQKVQEKLAMFVLNPLCIKAKAVPSVCEYFSTLSMLIRHYDERITSRIAASISLTTPEPHIVQNVLIHSAAKLIADCRSGKRNLARRISLPVERREIDRYINTVHIPRSDVPSMAMKTKLSPVSGCS